MATRQRGVGRELRGASTTANEASASAGGEREVNGMSGVGKKRIDVSVAVQVETRGHGRWACGSVR
jgi:hypothetical protein